MVHHLLEAAISIFLVAQPALIEAITDSGDLVNSSGPILWFRTCLSDRPEVFKIWPMVYNGNNFGHSDGKALASFFSLDLCSNPHWEIRVQFILTIYECSMNKVQTLFHNFSRYKPDSFVLETFKKIDHDKWTHKT